MKIIEMLPMHWESVRQIYQEGIDTGNATFQNNIPFWDEWDNTHEINCRLIATDSENIIGWAALTPVSSRCVYAGVGEVSVYVASAARGKGVGKQLLQQLIFESEKNNFWTLQAGIFPENGASIKIHVDCGFRIIGTREKIGEMNSVWRDTLFLERRSKTIGI
jgi:L-amino acid N-acyltransferase YncA